MQGRGHIRALSRCASPVSFRGKDIMPQFGPQRGTGPQPTKRKESVGVSAASWPVQDQGFVQPPPRTGLCWAVPPQKVNPQLCSLCKHQSREPLGGISRNSFSGKRKRWGQNQTGSQQRRSSPSFPGLPQGAKQLPRERNQANPLLKPQGRLPREEEAALNSWNNLKAREFKNAAGWTQGVSRGNCSPDGSLRPQADL